MNSYIQSEGFGIWGVSGRSNELYVLELLLRHLTVAKIILFFLVQEEIQNAVSIQKANRGLRASVAFSKARIVSAHRQVTARTVVNQGYSAGLFRAS